jgi:hypothetical protein
MKSGPLITVSECFQRLLKLRAGSLPSYHNFGSSGVTSSPGAKPSDITLC